MYNLRKNHLWSPPIVVKHPCHSEGLRLKKIYICNDITIVEQMPNPSDKT